MIKRKTLFIVGAGASIDLDFPSGAALVSSISQKLNFEVDAFSKVQGDLRLWNAINMLCQENSGNNDDYFRASREISSGIGLTDSIDRFVDAHSHDPIFAGIAKLAIAFFILNAEVNANEKYYTKNLERKFLNIPQNYWLSSFCRLHFANYRKIDLDTIFDNVAFVSFNYDRCIQHNLTIGLAKHFRLSENEAITLAAKVKIIHPYGSLGNIFNAGNAISFPFGSSLNPSTTLAASKGINTFTEGPNSATFQAEMGELMEWCENIVFVGFGFAEPNLQLLGSPDHSKSPKKVIGTAFGMKSPNIDYLNQLIPQIFHSPNALPLRNDLSAKSILDEYSLSLFS